MKYLFDNNISYRAAKSFDDSFSGIKHISDLRMDADTEDAFIWEYAKNNNFTIITKDNDFEYLSRLNGCPPKVIQLTCGNKTTTEIISILSGSIDTIRNFESDEENCLMFLK